MSEEIKKKVQAELNDLKEYSKKFSIKEIKSGEWFASFIYYALKKYAEKVDADYFRKKYPNVPVEGIVKKRIDLAKKYSASEGFLSSSAYTGTVILTIGSKGGASPYTAPAAITTFVVDLLYTTKLQLNLAYDMSVLYGKPADIEDPEDLFDLIKIAFGVKASEKLSGSVMKIAPEAVRLGIKATIKGSKLAFLKSLPVVGKYLLQRNIIKFAIPAVCIPLSTGMNYYFTGNIANSAKKIYKQRAIISERSRDLLSENPTDFFLLIEVIWLVINADEKISDFEISFINEVTEIAELVDDLDIKQKMKEFRERIVFDEVKIFNQIRKLNKDEKEYLYEAACITAGIDKNICKKEEDLLERIANACEVEFKKSSLKSYV